MADGGSLIPVLEGRRQRQVLAVVLALLGMVGHGAWAVTVDASTEPFLAHEAAEASTAVSQVFPNATPTTVRVVVEAEPGGNVLSPEALTALETLRTRITSDETLLPVLAREDPVASILGPLGPLLEGAPGEWDQGTVASALENATRTSQGQRALALFLDQDATIRGAESRAHATVLVVRLAGTAPPAAIEAAETRIQELADRSDGPGVRMTTDAQANREDAARSPLGWWVPAGSLVLLAAGLVVLRRPWSQVGRALALWLGGSGAALSLGTLLGQSTPPSLLVAHVAVGLGMAGTLAFAPRPPLAALSAALPPAALIGWAPAGTGTLAAVATAGIAAPLLTGHLWPGRREDQAVPGQPSVRAIDPRWWVAGVAVLVAGSLVVLAFAGLPDEAEPGWTGQLPASTEAGRAETVLSSGFRGPGPAGEFVVAAWGPVAEPGFLSGLDEASQRLERLSLAASGGQVGSVLTLAQDWATDDTDQDPTDDYDESFASLWEDATEGGRVPVTEVPRVLDALSQLDPEGTRAVLTMETSQGPRPTGAALLRQRVSLSDVVPRPDQAISAAIQPLLPSSEQVAVTGPILAEERTQRALLEAQGATVLATGAATVLGLLAWAAYRPIPRETWGALAGATVASSLLCLALLTAIDLPVRPVTLLAPAMTASLALLLGAPLTDRIGQALEEEPSATYQAVVDDAMDGHRSWVPLVPVAAVAVAAVTVRAPGVQHDGLALVVGSIAAVVLVVGGLPGLVRAWVPSRRPGEPRQGPRAAQVACPRCDRATATAAARCRGCGTWNLVQACPAHPDAILSSCSACGSELEEPSFR